MKPRKRASRDLPSKVAQAVMEFVLTYVWLFLIIGIMIVALYLILSYAPIQPPFQLSGACSVYRPYGPYTTQFITLQGLCNNELPKYVSQLTQSSSDHIIIPITAASSDKFTVSFWVDPKDDGNSPQNLFFLNATQGNSFGVVWENNPGDPAVPWQMVTIVINQTSPTSSTFTLYVNATVVQTGTGLTNGSIVHSIDIGGPLQNVHLYGDGTTDAYGLNAYISNLQLYNTSLTQTQLTTLYLEGVGGAPIDLTYLLGWWPLNGNTYDYSGNGKNAASELGISFGGLLTANYTIP